MVSDIINQALHITEDLLGQCESRKDTQHLADQVARLLEVLESCHSESTRLEDDLKRTSRFLQCESERSADLNRQVNFLAKIVDSPR